MNFWNFIYSQQTAKTSIWKCHNSVTNWPIELTFWISTCLNRPDIHGKFHQNRWWWGVGHWVIWHGMTCRVSGFYAKLAEFWGLKYFKFLVFPKNTEMNITIKLFSYSRATFHYPNCNKYFLLKLTSCLGRGCCISSFLKMLLWRLMCHLSPDISHHPL